MSISPKLSNSTPVERDGGRWAAQHDRLRIQRDVLERLMQQYAYQLKFVIAGAGDLAEVRALVSQLNADRDNVLLMPEGVTQEELLDRSRWLAEVCKEEGFRFCPRLHIYLWGNTRGT
jgi:7-carboxy-7-deazaguanine synthase